MFISSHAVAKTAKHWAHIKPGFEDVIESISLTHALDIQIISHILNEVDRLVPIT